MQSAANHDYNIDGGGAGRVGGETMLCKLSIRVTIEMLFYIKHTYSYYSLFNLVETHSNTTHINTLIPLWIFFSLTRALVFPI